MGAQCCTPAEDGFSNAEDYDFPDAWYEGDAVCVAEPFMTNDNQRSPVRMPKGLNLIITKVSHDRIAVRAFGAGNSEIWEAEKTYFVNEKDFDKLVPQAESDSLERKESIGETRVDKRRKTPRAKQKQILSPSEIAERVKKREIEWQTMVESHQKKKRTSKVAFAGSAEEVSSQKSPSPKKKSKNRKSSKKRPLLEDVDFGDNEGASYEQSRILNDQERIVVKKFDGDRQKWGVKVNLGDDLSEWRVIDLQNGGQFASKGVKIGWRFLKINNFQFKEDNRGMVEIILKEHQKCRITFLDNTGSVIDEEPAPPAPVGEVLHTHEDDYDHNEFVDEEDIDIPEEDSDAVVASVSEDNVSSPKNILHSPVSPPPPPNPADNLPSPKPKKKWVPSSAPIPDRPESPDVVNPPDVVMQSDSEDIPPEDNDHQEFELGEEYEIMFDSKPFGFSIIEDEYGENAYIDGIQRDWLEEQGLRMNSQVIEIDGTDVIRMPYNDIIDTMRGAQLPCMLRFRYSLGPELPPEHDDEFYDDDEYPDQSDSYQKYNEGSEGLASPHTSDLLPDELAEFEENLPESSNNKYQEPSSSGGRYNSSVSPRYRETSHSPLPATTSGTRSESPRGSVVQRSLDMFEAGFNGVTSKKDQYTLPKHKRQAFKAGMEMFEQQDADDMKKKKKRRKSSKKKRAAFAHALALFEQNSESELEKSPKKKPNRRRKGKKKDLTEDSGDEIASWARKEGESRAKMKKGFHEESAI